MAPQSLSSRIDRLEDTLTRLAASVHEINVRLNSVETTLKVAAPIADEVGRKVGELEQKFAIAQRELESLNQMKSQLSSIGEWKCPLELVAKEVSDLTNWKEELKKSREERTKMAWMIVPPIIAAVLTGIINLILFMYIRR